MIIIGKLLLWPFVFCHVITDYSPTPKIDLYRAMQLYTEFCNQYDCDVVVIKTKYRTVVASRPPHYKLPGSLDVYSIYVVRYLVGPIEVPTHDILARLHDRKGFGHLRPHIQKMPACCLAAIDKTLSSLDLENRVIFSTNYHDKHILYHAKTIPNDEAIEILKSMSAFITFRLALDLEGLR